LLKCINSCKIKIKNSARLSESDVILFKRNKPPAMALDPSSEIRVLDKIFYMFYLLLKYRYKIKNFFKFSQSDVILFKFFKPSAIALWAFSSRKILWKIFYNLFMVEIY